jgi:SAM-dependent methyltransferase
MINTPVKLKHLKKTFKKRTFKILDVGSGNGSPSLIKKVFSNVLYHGIDIVDDYNYKQKDFYKADKLFFKDLTKLEFEDIEDNYYDAILMAHIIEHLKNGDKVIEALLPKLKRNGYIYIEYPGEKSLTLPSKYGTLNFYDDQTHVRLYKLIEVKEILSKNGFQILESGTRRDAFNIAIMPIKIIYNLVKYRKVLGSVYWDWYGFAEYVYARKN